MRLKAFLIHLGLSSVVATIAAFLIFAVWYPYPYRIISGGQALFLLIVSVDVVLGPLMTLAVFRPGKSRSALLFDLSIIACVQALALGYGVWTMAQARPIHAVFEKDLVRVMHANDLPEDSNIAVPEGITLAPWTGPSWLAVELPTDSQGKDRVLTKALAGTFEAFQTELWTPYENKADEVWAAAHPVAELIAEFPALAETVRKAALRSKVTEHDLRWLPIIGRDYVTWTVLLAPGAKPVAYLNTNLQPERKTR